MLRLMRLSRREELGGPLAGLSRGFLVFAV